MPQGCEVINVDGTPCGFGGVESGRSYERGHEILVRHLMAHQAMETQRLAGAILQLVAMSQLALTLPEKPEPHVDTSWRSEPVSASPSAVERHVSLADACPDCGFRFGGSTCTSIHAKSTAGVR